MRHILTAAAALAACGMLVTAANAQTYQPGGPVVVGHLCKVVTSPSPDTETFGYYAPCGYEAQAQAPVRRHRR